MIVPMTLNGSGISDIARVLHVSINTVLKTIRQQAARVEEPVVPERITELEIDEMWSFVGKKANQCWLWYGFDAARKELIFMTDGDKQFDVADLARLLPEMDESTELVIGWREQKEVWWHSFESESEAVEAVKLEELERVDRDDGRQPNIPERLGGLMCQA